MLFPSFFYDKYMDNESRLRKAEEMADDMPRANEDVIKSKKYTYEICEQVGKGAFGAVFKVKRIEDTKLLAMKCESFKVKKQILKHEAKVFLALQVVNSPHFVHFEDRGKISGRFMFIVLRLVGRNLWDIRNDLPDKKFSLSTSMKAAEQTLASIRDLHRCGFLHRDIKPPNFTIGKEEEHTQHIIYILDFGLCRRYRTKEKDVRLPREKAAFRGTTRYASLAALETKDQCRKDDLESWWYMIVEWTVGSLPWKHCKGNERSAVKEYKEKLRIEANMVKVVEGMPAAPMCNILVYLDTVSYNMVPDYDYVYSLLETICKLGNVNPLEPPEWDPQYSEYKGPKYEIGIDYNMKVEGDGVVQQPAEQ